MSHQQNNPAGGRHAQKTVIFQVRGMACASCVRHVESALKGLDGVLSASAGLSPGQVTATYNPARVSPDEIRRTIEYTGYQVA